jgi:CheY-like chemotaxis protein
MDSPRRPRILIADHDQTFLDQLTNRLLQMNAEVDFAENGRTAVKLVESETYDLIITEIAMPIDNGLEILRKAREINPNIPILITTFAATVDWAEQAIREGAYDYLLRPLSNIHDFDRAVEEGLRFRPPPKQKTYFEAVFSQEEKEGSTQTPNIPPSNGGQRISTSQTMVTSRQSIPRSSQPATPFPENEWPPLQDYQTQPQDNPTSISDGLIELNERGQILSCNPVARNWLMLEANSSERPIKRHIQAIGVGSAPKNAQVIIDGRKMILVTKTIQDRTGSKHIILLIREAQRQPSMMKNAATRPNGRIPGLQQGASFSENLQKYPAGSQEQGWSPSLFFDQVKQVVKGEMKKIKENNPLDLFNQIFEPEPEEVDPEMVMTMSQRLSEIGGRTRSPF